VHFLSSSSCSGGGGDGGGGSSSISGNKQPMDDSFSGTFFSIVNPINELKMTDAVAAQSGS